MILEVQFQNLAHARQSFHFQKIPGALKLIFFCENWQGASFYIKEQAQKYKFERKWTIIALRNLIFYF